MKSTVGPPALHYVPMPYTGLTVLILDTEIVPHSAAALKEAEQRMDVRTYQLSLRLGTFFGVALTFPLAGMGPYTSRTPSLFGTESASPAIDVRNKLQCGGVVLVQHPRLPRVVRTGPKYRDYPFLHPL